MNNTETYTPGQLKKLMEIIKNVNLVRFQAVLGSGLITDIFDPAANLNSRFAVRRALGLGVLPSEHGSHTVNYDQSLDDMILASKHDWRARGITAKHFPITGTGQVEFEHTLFHFRCNIYTIDVAEEIAATDPKRPWKLGKIENLLAYGTKNPEKQCRYPIVGLGSVCKSFGATTVPILDSNSCKRLFKLSGVGGLWPGYFRFLAVREKVPQTSVS